MEELCGTWIMHDVGTQREGRLLRVEETFRGAERSWESGEAVPGQGSSRRHYGLFGSIQTFLGEWEGVWWRTGGKKKRKARYLSLDWRRTTSVRLSYLDFVRPFASDCTESLYLGVTDVPWHLGRPFWSLIQHRLERERQRTRDQDGAVMKKGGTTAFRTVCLWGKRERRKNLDMQGFATGKRADKFVSRDQASRWSQTVGAGQRDNPPFEGWCLPSRTLPLRPFWTSFSCCWARSCSSFIIFEN